MSFPQVPKKFGRLASNEKLSKTTVRAMGAAYVAAGVAVAGANVAQANVSSSETETQLTTAVGKVITLPAAPGIALTDGTTTIIADHYSHSSHVSHSSHTSSSYP